jgi:hypothetical protein
MRFVLHGTWVRKFKRRGKRSPHDIFMRVAYQATQPTVEWGARRDQVERGAGRREVVTSADAGHYDEAFLGDSFFDEHRSDEALCFSLHLAERTLYLVARSKLEQMCIVVGVQALIAEWSRPLLQSLLRSRVPPTQVATPGMLHDDSCERRSASQFDDGTNEQRSRSTSAASTTSEAMVRRRLTSEAIRHCYDDTQFAAALRDMHGGRSTGVHLHLMSTLL